MRMKIYLIIIVCCLANCSKGVEKPVVDYSLLNAVIPEWKCYQYYSIDRDSFDKKTYLEVKGFHGNNYPGFEMWWLKGGWSGYKTLEIIARVRDTTAGRFIVSIWDGKGPYVIKNRFEKEFFVDTSWTKCELSLAPGIYTPEGRKIDYASIKRIVFFTILKQEKTVFDVRKILLK